MATPPTTIPNAERAGWLDRWTGKGSLFDMGERFPVLDTHYESSIAGLHVIGNLAGTPDIKAALNAGYEVAHHIASQARPDPRSTGVEVLVVGAGPAGVNAALELTRLGIRHLIVESRQLFAQIRTFSREMRLDRAVTGYPGVKGDLWFGECTVGELLERWTRTLAGRLLAIKESEEVLQIRKTDLFTVTTTRAAYFAERVILAVGRPLILSRLGPVEDVEPKVLYRPPDPAALRGRKIVVLGATDRSVDAACQLALHNEVSVVYSEVDLTHVSPSLRSSIDTLATTSRVGLHPRSTLGAIGRDDVVMACTPLVPGLCVRGTSVPEVLELLRARIRESVAEEPSLASSSRVMVLFLEVDLGLRPGAEAPVTPGGRPSSR